MNNANDISSNPNGKSITPLSPVGGAVTGQHDPYYPSGRYPQGPFDDGPGFANSLRDYFRIFNKRRWLIISTVAAVLALGTLRTLTMTPMYTSSVRLQIDRNVAKAMDRGNVSPVESNDLEFLKTQNELLQSHNLAERVVSAARTRLRSWEMTSAVFPTTSRWRAARTRLEASLSRPVVGS